MSEENFKLGRVVFSEDTRVLAADIFNFLIDVCDQRYLEKNWFIFDAKRFPKHRIVKSFDKIDLFVLTVNFKCIFTSDKQKIKVKELRLGSVGVNCKRNFRPFVNLWLPNNFESNVPIHCRVANSMFSHKNIWQVILHELVHQNDKKAIDLIISKRLRFEPEKNAKLEQEANLTNLINSCSQKEIEKFLKKPSLDQLPLHVRDNPRLKCLVEENLQTDTRKKILLQALNAIKVANRVQMPNDQSFKKFF